MPMKYLLKRGIFKSVSLFFLMIAITICPMAIDTQNLANAQDSVSNETIPLELPSKSSNLAFSAENEPLILPKYFMKMKNEKKKSDRIEKKIGGLLQLQIQLRNSYTAQPTPERLNAMRSMGMKTVEEEIDMQFVYIHTKRKLSTFRIASFKKIGVIVYEDSWIPPLENHPTGFVIARMPVDRLYDLARKPFVIRLETAEQMLLPKNDKAAKSIYANNVWEDYGYDGTDVRIAVLDSGLDITHKDIPTPVASKDYSEYPDLDDTIENLVIGHGTHVTGSAVGRGTQSNGKYKGMAFGADLIFLKIGNDTTGGANTSAICSAIKAARDQYSADIITMSYGSFYFDTYKDGSDEKCQAVNYAFDKGALVFIAAGNEAEDKMHYSGTVTANSTTDYIKITMDANTSMSILYLNWFDGKGISNNLDLSIYNAKKRALSSPDVSWEEKNESPRGTEAELVTLNFSVSKLKEKYFLKVKNNSNSDQFFHIYSSTGSVTFRNRDADPNYTIGSPAIADDAIAVGSYVTRTSWTNYTGRGRQYTNATIDSISSFSSRGPRIDGIKKPDISAPGQGVISARDKIIIWPGSEDVYVIDNDGINDGNGPADYLLKQGTSMACPIAAGAAALLMQSNSSLKENPDTIRNALFQTASNNGDQTNTDGYGRINVLSALDFVLTCTTTVSSDRWKGEYYNNKDLSGSPAMVRDDGDGDINFDWSSDSPSSSCGIGEDNFSVRWTRTVSFDASTYRFTVTSDDGFKLYVDNSLKLDKWVDQGSTTYTVDVSLSSGDHTIKMEYYEAGGGAVAKLSWEVVSSTISVTSLKINNDASSTTSRTVTLNNTATGSPTQYTANESSSFSGTTWQTYSTAPSFTLSSGNGTKTVYFKVKNSSGVESAVVSDSIILSVSCTYSINPTTQSFGSSVGSGSVSVTTQSGCNWTAVSNNTSWITITSGSSGSGNGTVYYSVAANSSASSRTGTMTIAGKTFTVTQSGTSCTYSISPTSKSFDSGGGSESVTVTTQSGCNWTATSNASWITISSGSSGTGSGTVNYSVSANTSTSSRTGTITITGGNTFTVNQTGTGGGELPDLTSSAAVASSYTSGQTGVQIPVTVYRSGGNLTSGTYVHAKLYWSTDSTWDTGDSIKWSSNDSNPDFPNSVLNSTGSKTVTATIDIPSVSAGTYYIISYADAPTSSYPSGYHSESNENNNTKSYSVSIPAGLSITSISPSSATKGTSVTFTLTGTGFQSGFTAKLINELNVEYDVSSTQFVSSTQVKVTVYLGSGPTSTQYIKVTNPDGQNAQISFTAYGDTGTITVSSPNGGESWQAGTTRTISWSYTGSPGDYVKIELLKGGSVNSTITSSTSIGSSGSGSYSWTISSSQTTGSNYTVKVTSTSNSSYTDTSDSDFTITTAPCLMSITSISPSSANKGTTVTFTLTGTCFQSGFTAKLINELNVEYDIASSSTQFISSTQVNVTVFLGSGPTSTQYIKITNPDGQSAQISFQAIGDTGIIVSAPNGGESWQAGTTHTISWTYTGSPGSYVKIELLKGGSVNSTITSSTSIGSGGSGSYSWTISSTQTSGSDYKVRVTSTSNSSYTDTSDSTFTISAVTTNQSPTVGFTMTAQGKTAYENETLNLTVASGQTVSVSFSASRSSDSDGSIASYKWSINGTEVSTSRDFSYDLGSGTHQIYLEVWDNLGSQSAVGATIIITAATVSYQGHFANTGWGIWVSNGTTCGTPGGNQMEAIKITTSSYGIQYRAHIAYDGWLSWVSDGGMAGTTGQSKSLQAIEIKLTNVPSNLHVSYRAYVHGQGWQGWVSDGSTAGTTGQGLAVEAIEIKLENW